MADLTDEIPQRAFINAEIFQLAIKTGGLDFAINEISKKYNLSGYSVGNPAYVVFLLYCLVIFPKERWEHKMPNELINSINSIGNKIINLFEINNWKNRPYNLIIIGDKNSFLNKIRNSISHANINVDSNMNFTFFDKNNGEENFSCSANILKIMEFLSIIGAILANIRSKKILGDFSSAKIN